MKTRHFLTAFALLALFAHPAGAWIWGPIGPVFDPSKYGHATQKAAENESKSAVQQLGLELKELTAEINKTIRLPFTKQQMEANAPVKKQKPVTITEADRASYKSLSPILDSLQAQAGGNDKLLQFYQDQQTLLEGRDKLIEQARKETEEAQNQIELTKVAARNKAILNEQINLSIQMSTAQSAEKRLRTEAQRKSLGAQGRRAVFNSIDPGQ